MADAPPKFVTQSPGPTLVRVELPDGTKWDVFLNLNIFGVEETGRDERGTPKFELKINVATITTPG